MSIHGGDRTMLAVMDDGTLYCWRENILGQCDFDEFGSLFDDPIRVPGLPCVTKAAAGNVGIAMTANGHAFTWGVEVSDERGDGDGASPSPTVPTRLSLEDVTDVSAVHTAVGAVSRGQTYWWGTIRLHASSPSAVGQATAIRVSMDVANPCLLTDRGNVECWGSNGLGGLGVGKGDSSSPVLIDLPAPAEDVSAGESNCALVASLPYCWGATATEALGRGSVKDSFSAIATPAPIAAPGPFAGVAVAGATACAWRPTGEVLCWGLNWYVQYAPRDDEPLGIPRRVPELEPAKQVALVEDEVCSLGFDQVVRCRVREPDPDVPQTARVLAF